MTPAAQIVASETFAISTVRSKFDNKPKRLNVTWDGLCELLAKVRRTECTLDTCATGIHLEIDKDGNACGCRHKNGAGWIPAVFTSGRKKTTAEFVCVLVVDADHLRTDTDLDGTLAKLQRYRYVAHATHGDRPGNRCARIGVALSRAVSGQEWPRFWPAAMTSLGMPADPSCCDASRLYFLPARPSDADYWYTTHDGELLDVDAILAKAPASTAPPIADALDLDPDGIAGEGRRHGMLKSLAGSMRHRGAGLAEILPALLLANKRCTPAKPKPR